MAEGVRDQTVPIPKKQFDHEDEAQFRRQMERFMQDTRGRFARIVHPTPNDGIGGTMVPHANRWWTAGLMTNDASPNATLNTENRLWLIVVAPNRDAVITDLAIDVQASAASTNARAGIYETDTSTGLPTTLLGSTGDLDCSTTGMKSETLSAEISLSAGIVYWVGVALKGGTPAIWADSAFVGTQLGKTTASRAGPEACTMYEDIGAWTSLPNFGTADGYLTIRPFVVLKIG